MPHPSQAPTCAGGMPPQIVRHINCNPSTYSDTKSLGRMTRGRKKDLSIPASRALTQQRDYRARKAQYVTTLEERCRKAEQENVVLRRELELARARVPVATGTCSTELVRLAASPIGISLSFPFCSVGSSILGAHATFGSSLSVSYTFSTTRLWRSRSITVPV